MPPKKGTTGPTNSVTATRALMPLRVRPCRCAVAERSTPSNRSVGFGRGRAVRYRACARTGRDRPCRTAPRFGTVLTLTLGQQLQDFDWTSLLPPDWLGATIEAFLAAALLAWVLVRLRRPEARPPRPANRGRTGTALV